MSASSAQSGPSLSLSFFCWPSLASGQRSVDNKRKCPKTLRISFGHGVSFGQRGQTSQVLETKENLFWPTLSPYGGGCPVDKPSLGVDGGGINERYRTNGEDVNNGTVKKMTPPEIKQSSSIKRTRTPLPGVDVRRQGLRACPGNIGRLRISWASARPSWGVRRCYM